MSDPIGGGVESEAVLRKLDATALDVRTALRVAIGILVIKLQRNVVRDKLTGQVLKVRTGTLRRSIGVSMNEPGGDKIIGLVSTNLKYAPPHEYGFHGSVNVRAHLREIKQAFGRQLKTPVTVSVGAYSRNVDLPERSFLRSALRDMRASGIIDTDINAALKGALR
jgi:phage gpG-like protein